MKENRIQVTDMKHEQEYIQTTVRSLLLFYDGSFGERVIELRDGVGRLMQGKALFWRTPIPLCA